MTYTEFKLNIAEDTPLLEYYKILLIHSEDILLDLASKPSKVVAEELGLTAQKLSNFKPLLMAYYQITKGN